MAHQVARSQARWHARFARSNRSSHGASGTWTRWRNVSAMPPAALPKRRPDVCTRVRVRAHAKIVRLQGANQRLVLPTGEHRKIGKAANGLNANRRVRAGRTEVPWPGIVADGIDRRFDFIEHDRVTGLHLVSMSETTGDAGAVVRADVHHAGNGVSAFPEQRGIIADPAGGTQLSASVVNSRPSGVAAATAA